MRLAGFVGIGLTLMLGAAAAALAYGGGTPDGSPPAEETVCDTETGAAYGLCVAFCEANDCELDPDTQACQVLRSNYMKITGSPFFPCEGDGVPQ